MAHVELQFYFTRDAVSKGLPGSIATAIFILLGTSRTVDRGRDGGPRPRADRALGPFAGSDAEVL